MNSTIRSAITLFLVIAIGVVGVMFFLQLSAVTAQSIRDVESPGEIMEDHSAVGNWIFTLNMSKSNLMVVNTANNQVLGPYLEGVIGLPNDGVLDMVVTPDHRTLLISNFGQSSIHFVNIENPISPTWVMSVSLPFLQKILH